MSGSSKDPGILNGRLDQAENDCTAGGSFTDCKVDFWGLGFSHPGRRYVRRYTIGYRSISFFQCVPGALYSLHCWVLLGIVSAKERQNFYALQNRTVIVMKKLRTEHVIARSRPTSLRRSGAKIRGITASLRRAILFQMKDRNKKSPTRRQNSEKSS